MDSKLAMALGLLHLVALLLATFRLTEALAADQVFAPLRAQMNPWLRYLFTCTRCLSVWAGAICVGSFLIWPWLNWPLALSWVYFVHNDFIFSRRLVKKGRQLLVSHNNNGLVIERTDFGVEELAGIGKLLLLQRTPQSPLRPTVVQQGDGVSPSTPQGSV